MRRACTATSPYIRGRFRGSRRLRVARRLAWQRVFWRMGGCPQMVAGGCLPGVVFASVLLMGVGRLVAVGLVALALAGCSPSDADPGRTSVATPTGVPNSPTTSGTTSSPRSSGVSPSVAPSIPAAARAHTTAGAEAFLKFYLAEVNRAWQSADPVVLSDFALSTCQTCANFVQTATSLRSKGEHYAGAAIEVGPTISLPRSSREVVIVQAPLKQNLSRIVSSDGTTVRQTPEVRSLTEATIQWHRSGDWRIAGLRKVTAEAP